MSEYPEVAINKYVWAQFQLAKPTTYAQYGSTIPFFPVTDVKAGDTAWGTKPYVIYDSFIRARSSNRYFYPIKAGQLMYSIKGNLADIFDWRDFIANVLDREDAAANDINEFAGTLNNNKYFFHCINVSQLKYPGSSTKETGIDKKYATEVIIRYEYHLNNIYNNS